MFSNTYEMYANMKNYTLSGIQYQLPLQNSEGEHIINSLRASEVAPKYARQARELLIANYAKLIIGVINQELRKGLGSSSSSSSKETIDDIFVSITCDQMKMPSSGNAEDKKARPQNLIETIIDDYDTSRACLTTFVTIQTRKYVQLKLSQMFFSSLSTKGSVGFFCSIRKAFSCYNHYSGGKAEFLSDANKIKQVLLTRPEYANRERHVESVSQFISEYFLRQNPLDTTVLSESYDEDITGRDYYRSLLPELIGYENAIKLYTYYKVALPLSWGGAADKIVADFLSLPPRKRKRTAEKIKCIAYSELKKYFESEK